MDKGEGGENSRESLNKNTAQETKCEFRSVMTVFIVLIMQMLFTGSQLLERTYKSWLL
jgi:hypothetical protein